jgi:EAL domain-containing protein (putative c-di-GMP-specific phosphodiesterase class I)
VLKDPATADAIVKALHARGIAVALDDFGTGFSSLAHLQNWGVDTIKIDRSFVNHVTEAGPDQTIVLGIIGIARTLGMAIVAEGVELEAQRTWLMEHDCDVLQGYAISHPLPLPEYCALLAEWGLDQWGRKPTLQ